MATKDKIRQFTWLDRANESHQKTLAKIAAPQRLQNKPAAPITPVNNTRPVRAITGNSPMPPIANQSKGAAITQPMSKKQAPGEMGMTQQQVAQLVPELSTPQGVTKVQQELGSVSKIKPIFDKILQPLAKKLGIEITTRVKSPTVLIRKVAQKRAEGRASYGLKNINDTIGIRFVYKNETQKRQIESAVEAMRQDGFFHVLDKQDMKEGIYKATHWDIAIPIAGARVIRGEVQSMTQEDAALATSDHDMRAVYNENIPAPLEKLKDRQATVIRKMPGDKQKQVANDLMNMHKRAGDMPLPPISTAAKIAQVAAR